MPLAPHLRYQFKPFTGSSHSWALSQCELISRTARVLDIGAGSGAIGAELKSLGFSDVHAIELDPEARAHVAPIYKSVHSSISNYSSEQFDLVLLLDVLEHMAEPERYLKELLPYLAGGSTVLISVPNIAHWSIRAQLLFGEFRYTQRGILDRTHLQFFTRRRVRAFGTIDPALSLVELAASIAPVEFLLPEKIRDWQILEGARKFRRALAQWLPGLLAFQHMAILRKR